MHRRWHLTVLAASAILWGCARPEALRSPADAYSVVEVQAAPDELAAARAEFEKDPATPEAGRAAWILARDALRLGRWGDVESVAARAAKAAPDSPWLPPLFFLRLRAASRSEGALRVLQRLDEGLRLYAADPDFTGAVGGMAEPAVAAASQSDLETFLGSSPDGPMAPDVLLALGRLQIQRGAEDEAARSLRLLVVRFPSSPSVPAAFDLLRALSKKVPVNARVIGVLVPETGASAALGASLSQGVRLAQEELRTGATTFEFEFAFADTGGDPARALQAFRSLVTERQVIAAAGPLFSKTALICAGEANALGVVLMTPAALSPKLTQTGPYMFRSAMTPEQQAAGIARFAVEARQCRRFAVLAPDTAYGRSMSATFTSALVAAGGTVLAESRYPPNATDFAGAIIEIGGSDVSTFKERDEEFRRSGQSELEVFLQSFFGAMDGLVTSTPATATALVEALPAGSTVQEQAVVSPSGPPPTRVACYTLTPDPYTSELAQRLRAAALPVKTVVVSSPESGTQYSGFLSDAEAGETAELAGREELALSELLGQAAAAQEASVAVLIAVHEESQSLQAQAIRCRFAVYDTVRGRRLARHEFKARRPLPSEGNRYGIEAVYLPVPGSHLLHMVPQLVYHNLSVTLFGSDTWDDEALRRRPEAVTLDAYFTTPFWPDLPDSRTADFTRRYQERFAAPPDAIAAASYDAARLLMRAALDSDGTREGLRQTLAETGSWESLTGPARISPQREFEREPVILRISGGGITPAR